MPHIFTVYIYIVFIPNRNLYLFYTNIELAQFSILCFRDLSAPPPELLTRVFNHIPVVYLSGTIPKVCSSWHSLANQTWYWWQRLEFEGINITKEHKKDLIKNVDSKRLLDLLQDTCLHYRLPTDSSSFTKPSLQILHIFREFAAKPLGQ